MKHAVKAPTSKPDSSLDEALNPVLLPDGTTVAWAIAFPRS